MYAPPTDLDERELVEQVQAGWGLTVSTISYEPVGFGTHHYLVRDSEGQCWFVNVDDLTRDAYAPDDGFEFFARAFGTARALRDLGLEFVLAPVAARDGEVVVRLDDRYAVSVVPHVDASAGEFGEFATDDERRSVLASLGRLHATSGVAPDLPRRATFEIPHRSALLEAIEDAASRWPTGPFGEPCRALLLEHASLVRESFGRYDDTVRRVPDEGWVVTHGEPHAANVMWTADGSLFLIDWDTTAIGPRERDLWMVEPRDQADWNAYVRSGAVSALNDETIALYRLNWDLMEIAIYADTFRRPHVEDANTRLAWKGIQESLSALDDSLPT
jgi:spectinomycin phosphotransferase